MKEQGSIFGENELRPDYQIVRTSGDFNSKISMQDEGW